MGIFRMESFAGPCAVDDLGDLGLRGPEITQIDLPVIGVGPGWVAGDIGMHRSGWRIGHNRSF